MDGEMARILRPGNSQGEFGSADEGCLRSLICGDLVVERRGGMGTRGVGSGWFSLGFVQVFCMSCQDRSTGMYFCAIHTWFTRRIMVFHSSTIAYVANVAINRSNHHCRK